MITQSQNLSLSLYLNDHLSDDRVVALWDQLKESAVEAMQAPAPYLGIFAEDCLLCAIVMKKNPNRIQSSEEQIMESNPNELRATPDPTEGPHNDEPIGIIYVTAAPAQSIAGEANVGIIITHSHQRKGYACEAVELVLRWAFGELNFHRIQAVIMDAPQKDRAMRLFIGQGFTHEGTRKRSVFKHESAGIAGVWKDVTYLAMLDTEWALRDIFRNRGPAPTLWDEMFARHTREREEMVKWDERHNRIRRTSSTETLRNGKAPPKIIDAWPSDFESASSSCRTSNCGSVPPSPAAGVAQLSHDTLEYLELEENAMEEAGAESRQSSPPPYNFSFPSTPIPIPPRSPSVISSISSSASEDEGSVSPSWRGLHGIPASASVQSSDQLSWTHRPLIPIRSGSVSGSSESESWTDATDGPEGSDWDMMSEPERVSSR